MAHILALPCEICEEPHSGQCTKCKKFFCGEHLHYMGRDPDTGDNRLFCPGCLKKSKTNHLMCKQPKDITFADLVGLHEAVSSYISILVEEEYGAENAKQYIFERSVELFCGKGIWKRINELVK